MKSAEDIVRYLAGTLSLAAGTSDCFHCEPGSSEHAETCPYHMAVEWVAEQDRIVAENKRALFAWIKRMNDNLTPKAKP